MELKDGIYNAKVVDYGMKNSQGGKPQAFVTFELETAEGEGKGKHISWYGSFSTEKSTEFVIKTLMDCGFSAGSVSMLAAGIDGNSIPLNTPMVLVIENDSYGPKVKFVNKPGSSPAMARLSMDEVTSVLGVAEAIFQREKAMAPVAPSVSAVKPTVTGEKPKYF